MSVVLKPYRSVHIIEKQICYLSGFAENQCFSNPHILKLEIPMIQTYRLILITMMFPICKPLIK